MRRIISTLSFLLISIAANARVISYAPYTNRNAYPAVQSRLNRHFVLYETPANAYAGQLVIYDSQGEEEPRVIFPANGNSGAIVTTAVREDDRQLAILTLPSASDTRNAVWSLSIDGGNTWKSVPLPATNLQSTMYGYVADTGGPFVHGRFSPVRIGTHDYPFVVAVTDSALGSVLYAVANDGHTKQLFAIPPDNAFRLAGASIDGAQFLVLTANGLYIVGLDATFRKVPVPPIASAIAPGAIVQMEGWLTQSGQIYMEIATGGSYLGFYDGLAWKWIDGVTGTSFQLPPILPPIPPPSTSDVFFAIPSSDYAGAWSIHRTSTSTRLSFSRNGGSAVKQWEDVPASEVEALHAGKTGDKLLIQVHRPRQTLDLITFKDPALAVWHVGDPAPRVYDELFLEETFSKGFVHLDVDKLENGDQFVFDSGVPQQGGCCVIISPPPPSAGGGSDVTQEWGVVRASLAQKLVLPGAARTNGAYGSFWLTDVTFYNPSTSPISVTVRYVPNGDVTTTAEAATRLVTLAPREIRTIADVLKTLFLFEGGGGALFITPESGTTVEVTSRTYTKSEKGTFGFGMNAIDVYASASPRFPVTFSGAFLGANFRTNVVVTDVSGRGTDTSMQAWGGGAVIGNSVVPFHAPAFGQQQFNGISNSLGLRPTDSGSLVVQPASGDAVATLFAIDNRTNDATYFPPDIAVSVVRVIPAIGHLDGANGSKFRSDLYLFNNSDTAKYLTLQAKVWDSNDQVQAIPFTLLPHESRIVPDVLQTMFNKTGIARLRFWQQGSIADTSVRVTSRTYTIDENGGTYGFLMPPLNSFQSGTPGDVLEILGASLDSSFRTNLGLIDLTPWPGSAQSRAHVDVIDNHGNPIDGFDVTLPTIGGVQLNDVFRARNLPASATPVLIRVSVLQGAVGAYAAVVDNGTNDPAYFAANLGAKN